MRDSDLAAFNNRLNFEADFFRKETFDIIMTRSIPRTSVD